MPYFGLIYTTFETKNRLRTIRIFTIFIQKAYLEITHFVIQVYFLRITEEWDRVFVLPEHFCNSFSNPNCSFVCMKTYFDCMSLVFRKHNAYINKNLSCPFHSIGTLFSLLIKMQLFDLLILIQSLRYFALVKVFLNLRLYKRISLTFCQIDEGTNCDAGIFEFRFLD